MDVTPYLEVVSIGPEFVSIRDTTYEPTSFNPNTSGRFHTQGQPAFYAGSGLATAKAEVS